MAKTYANLEYLRSRFQIGTTVQVTKTNSLGVINVYEKFEDENHIAWVLLHADDDGKVTGDGWDMLEKLDAFKAGLKL